MTTTGSSHQMSGLTDHLSTTEQCWAAICLVVVFAVVFVWPLVLLCSRPEERSRGRSARSAAALREVWLVVLFPVWLVLRRLRGRTVVAQLGDPCSGPDGHAWRLVAWVTRVDRHLPWQIELHLERNEGRRWTSLVDGSVEHRWIGSPGHAGLLWTEAKAQRVAALLPGTIRQDPELLAWVERRVTLPGRAPVNDLGRRPYLTAAA